MTKVVSFESEEDRAQNGLFGLSFGLVSEVLQGVEVVGVVEGLRV